MWTTSVKTVRSMTQLVGDTKLKNNKSIILLSSKKDKSSEKGLNLAFAHCLNWKNSFIASVF